MKLMKLYCRLNFYEQCNTKCGASGQWTPLKYAKCFSRFIQLSLVKQIMVFCTWKETARFSGCAGKKTMRRNRRRPLRWVRWITSPLTKSNDENPTSTLFFFFVAGDDTKTNAKTSVSRFSLSFCLPPDCGVSVTLQKVQLITVYFNTEV